jgi:signal transduction histidine kinase
MGTGGQQGNFIPIEGTARERLECDGRPCVSNATVMRTPDSILHVLLVEDNDQHAEFFETMVRQQAPDRFRVTRTESVEGAREQLAVGQFDIILLDLTLPDSDGLATFEAIYAAASHLPVIVLSGAADEALAVETVQRGAQDYFVKGRVDHQLVLRAMRYAYERKKAELELYRANQELERRVEERTIDLLRTNRRLEGEIQERSRAERALVESNQQLASALRRIKETQHHAIQQERLHALGSMASGIAHDFNNSLAPIIGFTEMMLLRPDILDDRPKALRLIEMVHKAANDTAQVVARLRDFYRFREEAEVIGPVLLNDVAEEAISVTRPRWKDQALGEGRQITIVRDFGEIPIITGSQAELREMLTNLVLNAIDAILDRGAITIATRREGNGVAVRVTDTGMGMSEEVRTRCLEPFFSTKDKRGGTGLGLGIVYGIVRRHEGELKIESAPGRGTTITVMLPVRQGEKFTTSTPVAPPAKRPLRILVVDDEPLVREVIISFLSEDRHEIVTAENGREGLERFREGEFDVVLTDRAMPEMNGIEFAREVRKMKPHQPVVLLTGFGDMMSGSERRPPDIDIVVSKPFTLNSLRHAIEKSVSRE